MNGCGSLRSVYAAQLTLAYTQILTLMLSYHPQLTQLGAEGKLRLHLEPDTLQWQTNSHATDTIDWKIMCVSEKRTMEHASNFQQAQTQ